MKVALWLHHVFLWRLDGRAGVNFSVVVGCVSITAHSKGGSMARRLCVCSETCYIAGTGIHVSLANGGTFLGNETFRRSEISELGLGQRSGIYLRRLG